MGPEYSWSNNENYIAACCGSVNLRDLIAYCLKEACNSRRTSFHSFFLPSTIQEWSFQDKDKMENVIQFYLTPLNKQLKFCISNLLHICIKKKRIICYGNSFPRKELPWHEIQHQDSISHQFGFLLRAPLRFEDYFPRILLRVYGQFPGFCQNYEQKECYWTVGYRKISLSMGKWAYAFKFLYYVR